MQINTNCSENSKNKTKLLHRYSLKFAATTAVLTKTSSTSSSSSLHHFYGSLCFNPVTPSVTIWKQFLFKEIFVRGGLNYMKKKFFLSILSLWDRILQYLWRILKNIRQESVGFAGLRCIENCLKTRWADQNCCRKMHGCTQISKIEEPQQLFLALIDCG